jgi:5-methylcytosine-specific restriction endonuclease McrA
LEVRTRVSTFFDWDRPSISAPTRLCHLTDDGNVTPMGMEMFSCAVDERFEKRVRAHLAHMLEMLKTRTKKRSHARRRKNEFSLAIQLRALARQKNRCASCGTAIFSLGNAGRSKHKYGEGAQAHHRRNVKAGGSASVQNCVILCTSCHYCAHEGGNYRFGTVVTSLVSDYPHFRG